MCINDNGWKGNCYDSVINYYRKIFSIQMHRQKTMLIIGSQWLVISQMRIKHPRKIQTGYQYQPDHSFI